MDLTTTTIAGVFETRYDVTENPRYSVVSPEFIAAMYGDGVESSSGEKVTLEKALALAALWQVFVKIAQSIAGLPIEVYKRKGEDKKIDREDPASMLLRKQFNDDLTAYDGRLCLALRSLAGNAFAMIERDSTGRALALYPICCEVEVEQGRAEYYTNDTPDGSRVEIPARDIVHIKGPSWDGFAGADVIRYARDLLGQYLSAQKYTGRFFKNGAQAGGIYEIPVGMKPEAQRKMAESIDDKYSKPENWFKALKLFDGVKWQGTSFDPQKAQLIEQKNSFAVDVCRFFNMSPAMIGVTGFSSYNSLYEAKEQYLDDCLMPRLEAERVAYSAKLLKKEDWLYDKKFIEHNTKALLRMSPKDEQQVLAGYVSGGLMTQNEGRSRINLPPMDGGDELAELNGANNSGGANKMPTDPNNPTEPGADTLATQGKQAKADRAELIFNMLAHARSKAAKPKAFHDLVDGGMKTYRDLAEKAGFLDDFTQLLADFRQVFTENIDANLVEKFEVLAQTWKEKVV